ncbi:MAG: acetyl-coenzyme A synthetase, partial [Deltaproteobacteria bacterium]|nr:acetyl-coenzyme A synthetase [Deltaproteobacteria bacterium]
MSGTDDKITSLLSEKRHFDPPSGKDQDNAYISDITTYELAYKRSMEDPQGYWAERAEELVSWFKSWETVVDADLDKPEIRWFDGASLNVSYNCLDRHLESGKKDKIAIIWQGEPEEEARTYTYQELYDQVCRLSNVLKKNGVK